MVAGARARDAKGATGAFESPADKRGIAEFRGSFSGYERNVLFVNQGPGRPFVEAAYGWGLDDDADGRAVAPLDFDGDGDQDLVVLSLQHLKLWRNEAPAKGWVRIELQGKGGVAGALGAEVTVTAGARAQLDRVQLTAGFHTQVLPTLHFGLGAADRVESVVVRWPSGATQRWGDLPTRQTVRLVEGTAAAATRPVPGWSAPQTPPSSDYDLSLEAIDLEGKPALLALTGRPTVVNFWAPWCVACERELPALAALHRAWGDDARFVGVSVETEKLDEVRAFVARHGLAYPQRVANDAVVRSFFGPAGQMQLPATFVFDARGRLLRALFREVQREEVDALLQSAQGQTAPADLIDLARAAYGAGARDRAQRLLARVGQSDPLGAGQVAFKAQDWASAARLAEAALAQAPGDARALALRGAVSTVRGALDAARVDLEAAVARAPKDAQVLHNYGMYLKISGDRAGAIAAFQRALAADPEMRLSAGPLQALGVAVEPPRE